MKCLLALAAAAVTVSTLVGCASSTTLVSLPGRPIMLANPPASQIVFQVSGGGGMEPPYARLGRRPFLTVYGNGRALTLRQSRAYGGAPVGMADGYIGEATLRGLIADAELSGLFDRADFGDPQVTDLGTTSVTFRAGGAAAEVAEAYALSYTDGDDRLGFIQRRNRAALRTLITRLTAAAQRLDVAQYRPARVDVTAPEYLAGSTSDADAWPGPGLTTLLTQTRAQDRCGVLSGTAARRVYQAARDNSSVYWTVDSTVRALVVRALLPGEPGCRN